MPTYDYECTNCGCVFEMVQRITAKPKKKPDEPCAECGQMAPIQRLIGGGGAVLFKGGGFYETDYRSESYKKAAKAEKEATKGGAGKGGSEKLGDKKAMPSSEKSKSGGSSKEASSGGSS